MTWRWMGHKGCKEPECAGTHYSMGYCCKHYRRWMRHGHTELPHSVHRPCKFHRACGREVGKAGGKGMCHAHLFRLQTTGSVYDLWGRLDFDEQKVESGRARHRKATGR
jgi:hypothetical protein